jgi:phage-related protein
LKKDLFQHSRGARRRSAGHHPNRERGAVFASLKAPVGPNPIPDDTGRRIAGTILYRFQYKDSRSSLHHAACTCKTLPVQDRAFVGSSRDDLRAFPKSARREAGYQLDKVQRGEQPTDFKPMKIVGSGTDEIRIKESGDEYRVFYVAKMGDTVYVRHAFQKKSRKTPERHRSVGRRRYGIARKHAGE